MAEEGSAPSLGELLLEIGIDPSRYEEGLEAARERAIEFGQELEAIAQLKLEAIVVKTDETALTGLNQHLSLKEQHIDRVNQKTIKPKVDTSAIDALNQKIDEFDKKIRDVSILKSPIAQSMRSPLEREQPAPQTAKDGYQDAIASRIEAEKKAAREFNRELEKSITQSIQKGFSQASQSGVLSGSFNEFFSSINTTLRTAVETAGAIARSVFDVLGSGLRGALEEIGRSIVSFVPSVIKGVVASVVSGIGTALDLTIGSIIRGAFEEIGAGVTRRQERSPLQDQQTDSGSQDEGDRFARDLERSITSAIRRGMQQASRGNVLGGLFSAITGVFGSVINLTIGSIFRGAFERIGQEATADLGQGIAQGLAQEASFLLGSFNLLGKTLGEDLTKGIIEGLGRDIQVVENIFSDLLGRRNILKEGAATRGRQARAQTETNQIAEQQTVSEYQTARENLPQLGRFADTIGSQRRFLTQQQSELQQRQRSFSERAGIGRFEGDNQAALAEIEDLQKSLSERASILIEAQSQVGAIEDQRENLRQQAIAFEQEGNFAGRDEALASRNALAEQVQSVPRQIVRERREVLTAQSDELSNIAGEFEKEGKTDERDKVLRRRDQVLRTIAALPENATIGLLRSQQERDSNRLGLLSDRINSNNEIIQEIEEKVAAYFKDQSEKLEELDRQLLARERKFAQLTVGLTTARELQIGANQLDPQAGLQAERRLQEFRKQLTPEPYRRIAQEAANISGVNLAEENIPMLVANAELKSNQAGLYKRDKNIIEVSPEMFQSAQAGTLSREQVGTLSHELRHAFQLGFGRTSATKPAIDLIKPNFDEARELGERIEGSAQGKGRAVAALEADAYTFEKRFGDQIFETIAKDTTLEQLEDAIGIAGGKLDNQALKLLIKTKQTIVEIGENFKKVDISDEVDQAVEKLRSLRGEFVQSLERLRDIDTLPVDEILEIQQEIMDSYARLNKAAPQVAREFIQDVSAKPDRLRKEAIDTMGMLNRKKDLEPIARERGIETKGLNRQQLIDQLSNVEDIGTLHSQVMGASRNRAQQRLARQERIQDVAQTAGGIAKGAVEAGRATINMGQRASQAIAPMLQAAGESTQGLRQLAATVYKGAQTIENITLSLIPYGHLAKGVAQNVALPAATFTAATHLLPGGQMVGEGLTHLAQSGLSPIAHAGGDALISSAQGMIQGAVPNIMGLQGAVTSLVTNAIETGINAGVQIIGTAGAAIVGGKTIQNVATAPIRAIAGTSQPTLPALPAASQSKALPGVQYKITGSRQAQQENPQVQALPALPPVQEVQESVGRAIGKQAELIGTMIQDMKDLETSLSTKRKELKDAIKKKDDRLLNALPEEVEDLNIRLTGYLEQVQNLVKQAGDRAFGAIGLTNIGGIKGRQTQRQKGLDKDIQTAKKLRADQVPTDAIDVSNVQVPLPELKTPVNIPVPEMATIDVDVLQSVESLKAAFDSLTRKVIDVAKSDKGKAAIKDLAVNTAGFAASQVGGDAGLVGAVGGDIVGALTARLSINAAIAFKRAVEKLDPNLLNSANLGEKLNQIMSGFVEEFQSEAMQSLNGEDLFGDITGFIIGQATNALTGVTGSGAIAAMAGVPQLRKVKESVGRSPMDGAAQTAEKLLSELEDFSQAIATMTDGAIDDDALQSVESLRDTWEALVERVRGAAQAIEADPEVKAAQAEASAEQNFARFNQAENQINQRFERSQARVEAITLNTDPESGGQESLIDRIKRIVIASQPLQMLRDRFQEADEATGGLLSRVQGLGKAFVGLAIIGMAIGPLTEFMQASLQAAINLESLEQRASFAFGSVASGSQALQTAADTAKRYGNDLNSARESYLQLAQATQGTRLEGFQTEQIFNATQIAQRALGLPQEQVERINLAFSQVAGKGKASAEELRGQLGEAGISFSLMARAVGVSTQELDKMLERGEVFSDDFLPKLASQIESEMGMAALNAANTTQGALNNLGNEFLKLQETVGKAMLPIQNITISIATKGLEFLQTALPAILGLLTTLAGILIGKVAASFGIASLSAISFSKVLEGVRIAAAGLRGMLNKPMGNLGTAGLTAGFMGLFAIVDMFKSVFQDAGAESKKFAQEVRKSMEDYKKALADARRPPEQRRTGSRVTLGDESQPSNLEQNIVGGTIAFAAGLFGDQAREGAIAQMRSFERGGQGMLADAFENQTFSIPEQAATAGNIISAIPGFGGLGSLVRQSAGMSITPGATTGDVRNAQLVEGDRVLLNEIGGVTTTINEQVAAFRNGNANNDIGRLRAIDEQLNEAQSRRRTLDPSDTQGRRALDEQTDGLLRQREVAARPLARLAGIQAGNVEELQRQIQTAMEEGDFQRVEILQGELRKAQESLDALNASVRTSTNSVSLMVREFSKIEGELKKAVAQIEIFDARSRRAIATDIISGDLSQGQADFAQMIAQQETLGKRVEANLKALQEQTNILQSGDNQKILEQADLSLESTPEEIRDRASQMSEGSQERERLEAVADQVERLRDLNVETENLQTQIEESRAQAVTRLREAAQQIAEFYQGIEQQSRELQLETQRIQQQNRTQQAQNTLRGALVGFQESFISSFVESLVNIIETLNRPLDEAINAQQSILQAQQTYIQQVRQAYQQQQNLPTDADVQALGEIEGVEQVPGIATPGMSAAPGQMNPIASNAPSIPASAQMPGQAIASPTGQPDARGIISQADAMARLSPQQAAMMGRQGLQQAVGLAGQNYQQTVANAQSRLQQARENSQIEAQIQMDQANFGLQQAQRQMADQQRGFDRGLQSMSGQNNPIASLRNEFDDSMRSMESFRRGLLQTIEQAQQSRMRIVEGVEARLLPREMLQLLPELDNTLQAANTRLGELFSTQAKYQQAFKAQVQFLQEQQDFQVNQQVTQGRAQIFRAQAESDRIRQDEGSATVNDSAAQGAEIGSQLAERINELRLMRREGRLTEDQFDDLASQAREFANLSLDNVSQQLRRVRAESVSSALSAQGENPDRDEMRQNLDRMNRRAQLARRFGLISEEESTQFRRAGTLASSAIRGSQSDDAIMRQLTSGEGRDNPYFASLVEQMGRGDLVQLSRLGSAGVLGNSNAAMMSEYNRASSNGQQRSPTGAPVAAQVDTIIGLMQEMLPAMRNSRGGSVTINASNRNDAMNAYGQFRRDELKAANL